MARCTCLPNFLLCCCFLLTGRGRGRVRVRVRVRAVVLRFLVWR